MSIDDLRSIDNTLPIDTDLCLVGSGPAGWAIAEELRDTDLRILMLESGGRSVDPATDALNDIEDIGRKLFNGRSRVLGGTSRLWNGRCIPFDDIDFEPRSWVPRSGWPFSAHDVADAVDRAAAHLGAGPYYHHGTRLAQPEGRRPRPAVDGAHLQSIWWENPPYLDFGRIVTERRGSNLWVLVNATVTHVSTTENGRRVQSLDIADPDGRERTVRAQAVVLCAGGIENPRILLNSNRVKPAGIGNDHDAVGRYLMDHPRDFELIARVDRADADRFRDLFGPYRLDNRRGRHDVSHGFVLSPERQRRERLLNAAAWPYEVLDEDDPFASAKRIVRGPRTRAWRDLRNVLGEPRLLTRGMRSRLLERQPLRRKVERIGFLVASEQVPDPESRVRLGERRDRFGLPLTRVEWRVGELEARSQAALARQIAVEFDRLGLPAVQLADWVREERYADGNFVDGCHPTGTTRMSVDPRDGVVDSDCQVHGVHGLYVAGSSVFPTAGHANPTLMIVALAVRLAAHLRARLLDIGTQRGSVRNAVLAAD